METARLLVRREVVMNGLEHYPCIRRASRNTFKETDWIPQGLRAIHEVGPCRRTAVEVACCFLTLNIGMVRWAKKTVDLEDSRVGGIREKALTLDVRVRRRRCDGCGRRLTAVGGSGWQGTSSGASATKSAAPAKTSSGKWTVPRTPWGDPDLQGLWPSIDMQGTPYERPPELAGKAVLNEEEFAARAKEQNARRRGWGETGVPQRQASLIVEPADGRFPPLTPEGQARFATARSTYYLDFPDAVVHHPFNNFEDLGPYDRCITRGVLPSMMPTAYNMGNEIFQIPGYVIIRNEMIHETRSIPLDGRPHINSRIRQYMGDSRGHWEGDTLVIETTNFNGKVGMTRNGNTAPTSTDLRLVERLTRTDADTIQYEATVIDPRIWVRPWKVALPLKQHPEYGMFEYACHEGNYAMKNILSAARSDEENEAAPFPAR